MLPLNLTPEQFASLFPFHIVFDPSLNVLQVGHVLQRIYPALTPGTALPDVFQIQKPNLAFTIEELREHPSAIFQLAALTSTLELKGQMLWLEQSSLMVFLGAPWVTDTTVLSDLGLQLSDFAPHDPRADFLFVVQAQKTGLEEVRKLTATLTNQRAELRIREQNYRLLVENLRSVFFRADAERNWSFLNQAWTPLSGFTLEQSLGTSMLEYVVPDDRATLAQEIDAILARPDQNLQKEFRLQTQSGAVRWVEMTIYTIGLGKVIELAGTLTDVTQRHEGAANQTRLQEELIHLQAKTLEELSSPMIQLNHDTLVLPLIGSIDAVRAARITEALLQGVSAQRAQTVLVDITGVPMVDEIVANALINATQSVRLLGAQIILTGIRPEVAQTLVGMGVRLDTLITCSSLEQGMNLINHGRLRR